MILKQTLLLFILCGLSPFCMAQISPIDFEVGGNGANWNWTTFENDSNPPLVMQPNPSITGINTSATAAQFTALQSGQPWAGFESLHGGGIGTFTLDSTNSIIKVMVFKPVISDVGVKLVTPSSASNGELKVANTLINEWEELTFDFTNQIGQPATIGIDQIVIFPDFDLNGRTTNNICYIDNIVLGNTKPPINVTFRVNNTDSTPVYLFGDWNNWNNFPGEPMTFNASSGLYEVSISLPINQTIEYQYVNGISTQEDLDPMWTCTNGDSQYTNRQLTLGTVDTSICNIWESCSTCAPLISNTLIKKDLKINATSRYIEIKSAELMTFDRLEIFDISGRKLTAIFDNILTNNKIAVELLTNKIYFIRVWKNNISYTQKAILVH